MFDLIDDFFDGVYEPSVSNANKLSILRTDIEENPDSYILYVDMPGAKKENISVNFSNKNLKISYHEEKNENEGDKKHGKFLKKERFSGDYSRSYYFSDVDKENIAANYKDGVLIVVLHKINHDNEVKSISIQ